MIDQKIKHSIESATSIGICSHIRPDGDAVGAVLGLGISLMEKSKQVQMVLKDGVSQTFKHLEGADQVKRAFSEDCDLYIVLDCSDEQRIGGALNGKLIGINIDHHITNTRYGEINLIDDKAVATCAILTDHMPKWGLTINRSAAAALLSGILSDSIGFRTSNTTAHSLCIAAELMELGADISSLYNKALISRSFEAANYWGYALGRLERENGLIWTSLTLEDRQSSKYPGNDDADLTNILSSIDDMDIAILFIEQRPDKVKVSWRARPGLNVSGIASSLGGGGHPAAAGADITGNMDEVKQKVIDLTRNFLDQVGNGAGDTNQDRKTE